MMDSEREELVLLGTATSQGVPVLTCSCPVCRSTDPRDNRLRASALLRSGDQNFAIDAGPDFRQQMLRAQVKTLDGVLITHEHNDHTAGLDDLRPYCFAQGIEMPVYCLPRVAKELRERFAYAFSGYPGVPRLDIREVNFGDRISFGQHDIELLEVSHGPLPIFGIRWGDLGYLTDVKSLPSPTLARCTGLSTLVLSALNRTGTHSHLSLDEALSYLRELKVGQGVLTHFSHGMGRSAELSRELPPNVRAGWDGMVLRQGGAL